jgi:hypothetical protein
MSRCSHEAYDSVPTARDWLDRAEAAVCAIAAAHNALRHTPNDHGWVREGQPTELKKRTDAYYNAVHYFLALVRQAQKDYPQALSAIQNEFDGLLQGAASISRTADPGSEEARSSYSRA